MADKQIKSIYQAWYQMMQRCHNPENPFYKWYGARGISVCERWHEFHAFRDDMGQKPSRLHSLDRIDNNRGYSPENCRWATRKQQSRNTRANVYLTVDGETHCLATWCDKTGISPTTLSNRLRAAKWAPEKALLTPVAKKGICKNGHATSGGKGCDICKKERAKQYYLENRERFAQRSRDYARKNVERVRQYKRQWKANRRATEGGPP